MFKTCNNQKQSCLSPSFIKCRKEYLGGGAPQARDIAPAFLRCFSTGDGEKVLAWLHSHYSCNTLGPEVSNEMLRYREGQRQLVQHIERLIAQARAGN
jgi:hypothetical protein